MKKLICLFITAVMLLSITACGNSDTSANEDTNQASNREEASATKDGLLFTTKYEVEDYVENAIIVSKNNGLLYGMLDNSGNIIIPIKYDDLYFVNKADYLDGCCDSIYLSAEYEDTKTIYDISGNTVIEGSTFLYYIDYILDVEILDNTPLFYEKSDTTINLYNKKGKKINTIYSDSSGILSSVFYISDKVWMEYNQNGIILRDYENTVLKSYEGAKLSKYFGTVFESVATFGGNAYIPLYGEPMVCVDENGNISETEDTLISLNKQYPATKKYSLYNSNSTWKLEDSNGNTLYYERYYDAFEIDGENDCHCLINEDNQILLIGRNAEKYIDYGTLETSNNGDTIYMIYEDTTKSVKKIYEGKESVVIPVSSSTSGCYDIYYFGVK